MVKALFIGSHCDDCEWMAGGTTVLLRKAKVQVHYLYIFGRHRQARKQTSYIEAGKRASGILSVELHLLDFHPQQIKGSPVKISSVIFEKMQEIKPQMVFIQPPRDYMVDHLVVAKASCHATSKYLRNNMGEVYAMESPACPFPFVDIIVDIGGEFERVRKALMNYCLIDVAFGKGLVKTKKGLALLRGEQRDRVQYGEAFKLVKNGPLFKKLLKEKLKFTSSPLEKEEAVY
ncbi:MAG: PIG-L family deacetylase [Candidatus Omnitrophota bacterium]